MLLEREAAIAALSGRIGAPEIGASSHWRFKHRHFEFVEGRFRGLNGFGSDSPPRTALHRTVHYLLQTPFRRMGAAFPTFTSDLGLGRKLARAQQRQFEIGWIRHVLTLSFVRQRVPQFSSSRNFLVIGDGFATMAALLLAAVPSSRVTFINLTRTLLVDLVYLGRAHPDLRVVLVENEADFARARHDDTVRAVAMTAENWRLLAGGEFDVAFNMTSMQEMNPETIAQYFDALRAGARYFYCCNRVEKHLPDGTVVRFADYPWSSEDEVLVDGLCPWNQYLYQPWPPFYRAYLGAIQHRLVQLAPSPVANLPG